MELVLSAIAAGGLVGASNQYACLLVVGLAARFGLIQLAGPVGFMGEWWFIIFVGILWIVTIGPALAQQFAPGLMHFANSVVHFISGFVVPLSAALVSLASVGVLVNLSPELQSMIDTLKIFNGDTGALGGTGLAIAGGSAVAATAITGMKALAKPMISTTSGTAGTASAPAFVIAENIAAVVLMALAYGLSQIDPWLLVGLFGAVLVLSFGLLLFGLYQLYRLKKGLGRVLYLLQAHPRAGLAVCVEFFVWGLGWLVWKNYGRGWVSLIAWGVWLTLFIAVQPVVTGLFVWFPPAIPLALLSANFFMIMIFFSIGVSSARALLKVVEKEPLPSGATLAAA
jgi:hypothetical protein